MMVTAFGKSFSFLRRIWWRSRQRYDAWKAEREVAHRWAHYAKGKPHNLPAQIIVSLTSYPARFEKLPLTLKCLLTQTVAPDRLILWIAHQDKSALTNDILSLENEGMVIMYCDDLKSYKKIVPTLQIAPEAFIVTADDDSHYWPTWLEDLTTSYAGDNSVVICHRAHKIRLNEFGMPGPYAAWDSDVESNDASPLIFPTGAGGVLYPPNIFHTDVLATELFKSLCPRADDVWLYWMVRLAGGKSRKVGKRHRLIDWPGTQETALWKENLVEFGNDPQIAEMACRFGFSTGKMEI
ncbi:MAG: hypothetical protein ACOH1I_08620 [Gallionellaceae bacterium]